MTKNSITTERPSRARIRPTRAAGDPKATRSRWIEAFYVAEAQAQLDRQTMTGQRGTR